MLRLKLVLLLIDVLLEVSLCFSFCFWNTASLYFQDTVWSTIKHLHIYLYICYILTPAKLSKEEMHLCKLTGASGRGYQGATLTVDGLNWVRIMTLAGGRWMSNYYITPSDRKFTWVGEKMLEWELCPSRGWAPAPQLSSPGEWERNAAVARRVGGGVNFL